MSSRRFLVVGGDVLYCWDHDALAMEALMVAPIDGAKRDMLDIVPPARLGPAVPVVVVSVYHCGEPSGSPQAL